MRSGILLVDDDQEDQFIFCDAMKLVNSNEPVHIENNGINALDYLSSLPHHLLPCVILADLNMPKMNGRELLIQVKASGQYKNIPVIIYTTSVNKMEKQACLHLGAHDYITKPLSYAQSIEVAEMVVKLCRELQEQDGG